MTNLTPPSASADNEQEDELDSIIAYINGCTRKPDGTLFLAQADYLKNLIDHHTKEAERRARIEGMKELATELKCYDWQLEDTINSNDVVCEQIDFSLAELAVPTPDTNNAKEE